VNAISSKEFADLFKLDEQSYGQVTLFNEPEVGFSIVIEISDKIRNKLDIVDEEKYVTLMHVYLDDDSLKSSDLRKSIGCRANFVHEMDGRFLFDDKSIQNKEYKPIDLESEDEYFLDTKSLKFYRHNREIEANQIINDTYKLHTKTASPIKGAKIRAKLTIRKSLAGMLKLILNLLSWIYFFLYGDRIRFDLFSFIYPEKPFAEKKETISKKEGKKISLFGYEAPAKLIVSYCTIHLCLYLLLVIYEYKPRIVHNIFSSNFLTIAYVIMSLAFMEVPLKKFLHFIIKKTGEWSFIVSTRNIKI